MYVYCIFLWNKNFISINFDLGLYLDDIKDIFTQTKLSWGSVLGDKELIAGHLRASPP